MSLDVVRDLLLHVSPDIKDEALALLFHPQHGFGVMQHVRYLYGTASFEGSLRHYIKYAHGQGQYLLDKGRGGQAQSLLISSHAASMFPASVVVAFPCFCLC